MNMTLRPGDQVTRDGRTRTFYPIELKRSRRGWTIRVAAVGVTWASHLDAVEDAALQLLAAALGGTPEDYTIDG